MSKRRGTRNILLLAGMFLLISVLACCLLWQYVLAPALQSADWGEGYVLLPKRVPANLEALPAKPTEQDFVPIAIRLLETESGREGFYPDLVMWTVPCGSDIHAPTEVYVLASRHIPSHRRYLLGTVKLWPQRNEAEIEIWDGGKQSVEDQSVPVPDFSELRWHVDDLLHLAEEQGGQEHRQAIENQCEVTLRKDTAKTWLVEYRPLQSGDSFCMIVEDQTGVYTVSTSATECDW